MARYLISCVLLLAACSSAPKPEPARGGGRVFNPGGGPALAADPNDRRPVLVAISGYGRDEDKRRALDAGFDAHMTKPVDHDRVEAFLREVAASPREGRPATVH